MQVLSACAVSFSHGANDVANSIGSFTAAFSTWQNSKVSLLHGTPHRLRSPSILVLEGGMCCEGTTAPVWCLRYLWTHVLTRGLVGDTMNGFQWCCKGLLSGLIRDGDLDKVKGHSCVAHGQFRLCCWSTTHPSQVPGADAPVYTWILALGATGIVVGE
jgi:phosphate/sulfate permease